MIIVDEFQDTDDNQWRIVRALAEVTDVFCLADLEQRIFDYRDDVDPRRLDILREAITFCSRSDSGTRQSFSVISPFCTTRNAILVLIFSTENPGLSFPTTKPLTWFEPSSRAQIMLMSAKVPERAWSQSRQSSHQLPFRFSAAVRNASGPPGSTGPITNDAFGLVGGLSRL